MSWTTRLARLETAATALWLTAVVVTTSDTGIPFPVFMVLFGVLVLLAIWWFARGVILLTAWKGSQPGLWLAWLRGPVMVAAGILLASTPWLLAVRLSMSSSSLLREAPALSAISAETLRQSGPWVGLFRVREFAQFGPERRFITNECGLVDTCGLVYSPGGTPSHRGEDSFTHLYGPWWHLYQSW
jgi:hypothetical protein